MKAKTWSRRAILPYIFYLFITINEQKLAEWLISVDNCQPKNNDSRNDGSVSQHKHISYKIWT